MALLSAPAVSDLLQNVRSELNQPNAANSFWTDEELIEYLNKGVRRYFAEIVPHCEGWFTASTDLDIVANSEIATLPSDCFEVRALYRAVSGGYEILSYRNNLTESYSTVGGSAGNLFLPYYYFRGTNLVLRPVPNFSETAGLRLEYIQFPDTMVTGGDSLTSQVAPVFKDLIEGYAVYRAKMKESHVNGSTTYTAAKDNLNDLYMAFKEAVVERSKNPTAIIPFNPEEN